MGVSTHQCPPLIPETGVRADRLRLAPTGGLLGRLPDIAIEGALAPEAASRGRDEEIAVGAVDVDLGFEHPGQGRWYPGRQPSIWLHKRKGRHLPALSSMRPTRIELATSGLKDRRSLVPVKGPLTTELRAPCSVTLSA